MRIAILDTVPKVFWPCDNNITDAEKFTNFLTPVMSGCEFKSFYVAEGEFPNDLTEFDGYLITGSPCSANGNDKWITQLKTVIIDVVEMNRPLVGFCFGHQLIAKSLGGTVSANERGWNIGLFDLIIEQSRSWMKPENKCMPIYHFNKERVIKLPDQALPFAQSEGYPFFGYTIGSKIMAIQGHPEQPKRAMLNFLSCAGDAISPDVVTKVKESFSAGVADSEIWATWTANFFFQPTSGQ